MDKYLLNDLELYQVDLNRIIEMAWEDRTPFEAIRHEYNLDEKNVVKLMRRNLTNRSFKSWRKRVSGRNTKHVRLRGFIISRAFCPTQYKYS